MQRSERRFEESADRGECREDGEIHEKSFPFLRDTDAENERSFTGIS